jgi:hypothetical protein
MDAFEDCTITKTKDLSSSRTSKQLSRFLEGSAVSESLNQEVAYQLTRLAQQLKESHNNPN